MAEKEMKKIEKEEKYQETIDLNPYTGNFVSTELSCTWELKNIENRLVIKHPKLNDFKLKNTGTDKFGFIEFIRNQQDKVVGLKILGDGIEFVKIL